MTRARLPTAFYTAVNRVTTLRTRLPTSPSALADRLALRLQVTEFGAYVIVTREIATIQVIAEGDNRPATVYQFSSVETFHATYSAPDAARERSLNAHPVTSSEGGPWDARAPGRDLQVTRASTAIQNALDEMKKESEEKVEDEAKKEAERVVIKVRRRMERKREKRARRREEKWVAQAWWPELETVLELDEVAVVNLLHGVVELQ